MGKGLKRVTKIQEEFNTEKATIQKSLDSSDLDTLKGVSFPSVETVGQGHFNIMGLWCEEPSKYRYASGTLRDSREAANNDRNADIDSKKSTLQGRISKCNSYKGNLDIIMTDCADSEKHLNNDISSIGKLEGEFNSLKAEVNQQLQKTSNIRTNLYSCYGCEPTNLVLEMSSAGRYLRTYDFDDSTLKSGKSLLEQKVAALSTVSQNCSSLKSKLDERIKKLEKQMEEFENQKVK